MDDDYSRHCCYCDDSDTSVLCDDNDDDTL